MSWFDAGSLSKYSTYAKTALKQAQKNIDKVLDIKEEESVSLTSSQATDTTKTSPRLSKSQDKISPSPTYGDNKVLNPESGDDTFFESFLGSDSPVTTKPSSSKLTNKNEVLSSTTNKDSDSDITHAQAKDDSKNHKSKNVESEFEEKNGFENQTLYLSTASIENSIVDEPFQTPNTSLDNKVIGETFESIDNPSSSLDNKVISKTGEDKIHDNSYLKNDEICNGEETRLDVENNFEGARSSLDDDAFSTEYICSDVNNKQSSMDRECLDNIDSKHLELDITDSRSTSEINSKLQQSSFSLDNPDKIAESSMGNREFNLGEEIDSFGHRKIEKNDHEDLEVSESLNISSVNMNVKENVGAVPEELPTENVGAVLEKLPTEIFPDSAPDKEIPTEHDSPQERLNASSGNNIHEKELKRLQELVIAREEKLVQMSTENISLQESIAVYRSQLTQLESVKQTEESEVEEMQNEFMQRIGESDRKLQVVIKERDILKEKFEDFQQQLSNSADEQISALSQSLIEKEEKIQDLLTEGEILSKKEFEANTRIKKFRVKLKDVTSKNEANMKKAEEYEVEIESLQNTLKERDTHIKKIEGDLKKLESITDSQEDEVSFLREKFDDREEEYKTMETTLQNAYQEINQLNLEKAQKTSEAEEATAAAAEKEEIQQKLQELEKKSKFGKEELLSQLEDLQTEYSRLEQQSARREENLKREIRDLQQRIEEGENRNQELSQSVTGVTKPLLRQIENLQATYNSQAENSEIVEKNLLDRISTIQQELLLATEKERSAAEIAIELKSKVKVLEKQMKSLKDEKTKLEFSLDDEKNGRRETLEAWKKNKIAAENEVKKYKEMFEKIQNEMVSLEDQLSSTKVQHENDVLQLHARLSQQQQHLDQQQQQHQHSNSRRNSGSSSVFDEQDASYNANSQTTPRTQRSRSTLSTSSAHDSILGNETSMTTTTTASLEQMQRVIRKRDGEVYVLKEEIITLEKTKASLAQELVNLSHRVEELESSSTQLEELQNKHNKLESRYGAVLQMYGEKAEEADELKMDLQDIKTMYKQQIQDLLGAS